MHRKLSLIFFISGASALIFETLWFRMAGLSLGNSVWSVSLVLAAFMAGIAIGNAAVTRLGARLRRPILVYAQLEIAIGLAGIVVVLGLPSTSALLGGALGHLTQAPALLNLVRLASAFVVLAVPAIAMGATLPVLTEALSRRDANFGAVLGRLYGWNTFGAMLGAIVSELLLIKWLGIIGSGLAAMLLNLLAALVARRISQSEELASGTDSAKPRTPIRLTPRSYPLLAVAFLSGGAMLALEVVWFRFLLLRHYGTSLLFAIMLAVVLGGIAAGGLIAARIYRIDEHAHAWLAHVTAISGALVALTYAGFDLFTAYRMGRATSVAEHIGYSIFLMLPVSIMSGIAFTMCGRAVKGELGDSLGAAGATTFANTIGAMLGSLLGAFVLLPVLGMERSFFTLAATYAVTALLVPRSHLRERRVARNAAYASAVLIVGCLLLFPFGLMQRSFLRVPESKFPNHTLIETREGLTETASYYSYDRFGQPIYYRLMTNDFSMSATNIYARRYMKLFVYLPLALKPDVRDALLISFGTGTTAKALTDSKGIDRIDVVDISRTILDMSAAIYSEDANPLNDDRVNVQVEDGRFFLNASTRRYDLITSEPPPPMIAGVVNLYSQEYFELVREHLNPGGLASYWLPVHQLEPLDALAIVRAFCNAFEDCSLWSGSGFDWILLGSNDAQPQMSLDAFSAQWREPSVRQELVQLGVETPLQLGALFMADAAQLAEFTGPVLPVNDNHPLRISDRVTPQNVLIPLYHTLMDTDARLERFRNSSFIDEYWPEPLKQPTEPYFGYAKMIDEYMMAIGYRDLRRRTQWEAIDALLENTPLQSLPLWLLGSDADTALALDALETNEDFAATLAFERAVRSVAARDYQAAVEQLDSTVKSVSEIVSIDTYLVYLYTLARTGRLDEARVQLARLDANQLKSAKIDEFIDWYVSKFLATAETTSSVSSQRSPSESPRPTL